MTIPVRVVKVVGPIRQQRPPEGETSGLPDEAKPQQSEWHYGGFVDLGCLLGFNVPENHRFRDDRPTTRVNQHGLDMMAWFWFRFLSCNGHVSDPEPL